MKKLIALLLAAIMVMAIFVGCSSKTAETPSTDTPAADTPAADTPAATTDAPADVETPEGKYRWSGFRLSALSRLCRSLRRHGDRLRSV